MIYADSSVIVAILLSQSGFEKYQALLDRSEKVWSSCLLEAEVFAAAARESVELDLAQAELQKVALVSADRGLILEYKKIFTSGHCKGADALHLATALYLDPTAKNLLFLTADSNQKSIAQKLGFRVE